MKVRFVTLGCKVNQVESQALANVFKADGFDIVKSGTADIIVVNSCSVTSEADRKTRQTVRRLRRENPSSVLVLTGCMPQTSPESVRMEEADIVTGTRNKSEIPSLVMSFLKDRKRKEYVIGHSPSLGFDNLKTDRFDDTFQKAYLKIEDGCDRFCSYCIIPYARGEVRSLPLEEVRSQAAALIQSGYREIILTGINLSRYGVKDGLSLADAVEAVNSIEGDFRIRLGSLEPDLITENDWLRMSKCDKLCPHFHLALQSGCDKTLKRMNRRYTTAEYKKVVDTVRELFSGCAVTTDIMVGFPNESDEEFAETCAFVKSLKLMSAHLFIYSPRPNTPASKMPQVNPAVAKLRQKALAEIIAESGLSEAKSQLGRTVRVLCEANGLGTADDSLEVVLPKGARVGEFSYITLTKVTAPAQCAGIIE